MREVIIEPRSPQWHEWRANGIGASDIGVLTGSNPYSTPRKLWSDKFGEGRPVFLSDAIRHGVASEPKVRRTLNENTEWNLKELCCEDDANPRFRASLDGWDADKKVVVEIKCPVNLDTIDDARDESKVHPYWIDQLQWQMMITQALAGFIAVWDYRTEEYILVQIEPDAERWEQMRKTAAKFWDLVQSGTEPEATERDYIDIDEPELNELLVAYAIEDRAEKEAKAKKTALRDSIWSFGEGQNFRSLGFTVFQTNGRVSYDYATMKSDGVDLSPYEKVGKKSFRITVPKE